MLQYKAELKLIQVETGMIDPAKFSDILSGKIGKNSHRRSLGLGLETDLKKTCLGSEHVRMQLQHWLFYFDNRKCLCRMLLPAQNSRFIDVKFECCPRRHSDSTSKTISIKFV